MLELNDESRPLLRPSVIYAPVVSGVYVELGDRNFLIKGAKLAALIVRLIGVLNGRNAVGAIRQELPEAAKPMFDAMLKSLDENGMLVNGPIGLIAPELITSPIARLLQDTTEHWEQGVADFLTHRITVWSDAEKAISLVRSLLAMGAREIAIVDTGFDDHRLAGLQEIGLEGAANFRVVSPESAALAGDQSPLIFLGTEDAFRQTPMLAAAALAHDVVFPAILMPACALVGPAFEGGIDNWNAVPLDVLPVGDVFPAASVEVTAALLAMELIQGLAARHGSRETAEQRSRQIHVVHADGTVRRYDREVLLASGRTIPAEFSGAKVGIDGLAGEPSFDPDIGVFEPEAPDQPPFPLCHQAMRIYRAGASGQDQWTRLESWGVTAQDAFDRVMLQACEFLAAETPEAKNSIAVAARRSPEEASSLAGAIARSAHAANGPSLPRRPIDIEMDCDADGRMLIRLARLYWRENPEVTVSELDAETSVAWACLGEVTAVGIGCSIAEAVTEALGEVVSAIQRGQLSGRQGQNPWLGLRNRLTNVAPTSAPIDVSGSIRVEPMTGMPSTKGVYLAVARV